ncbi:MAG: DnaA family protein [Paracoccaceae bacterium]|jgi:DnaA family protein
MSEQLPLGLGPDKSLRFANFHTLAPNRLLVNQLCLQALGEGEQWVYVHGARESGRSHLLQASCQAAAEAGLRTAYLPLKELLEFPPQELLSGVEQLHLLCIDDLEQIAGNGLWEEALFHSYNRMMLSGSAMLIAAAEPAATLAVVLPDLRSRLSSFSVYQLRGLQDEEKMAALRFRAECLGMELGQDIVEYLYHRTSRNLESLFACLEQLDRESLRQKRALTKPFVKQVMGW